MATKAFHGGAFFDSVGRDFQTLEHSEEIISADVLDAWFAPSPKVLSKIKDYLAFTLQTSPPTQAEGLIQTISEVRGLPSNQILVGAGSSDLLFVLLPRLLKQTDRVAILDPMYGEYAHILTHVFPVHLLRFLLERDRGFEIDTNRCADFLAREKPSMFCIVNPNNPSGRYWRKEEILQLVRRHRETIFLIDEAYIEYVGKEHSLERNVSTNANLIVVKSMSKGYALSGARVAYAVCSPSFREPIGKWIPPWAVSLIGQIAGVEALLDEDYYVEKYAETHRIRERMVSELTAAAISRSGSVYNSCANWAMLELGGISAGRLVEALRREKIFIRHCGSMSEWFGDDFVRIATKDPTHTDRVISATIKCAATLVKSRALSTSCAGS